MGLIIFNNSFYFLFLRNIRWIRNKYIYFKIFEGVNELLNERALLAFEMGFDQRELMEEALQKYFPNDPYEIIKDINGKDRMLFIYRNLK